MALETADHIEAVVLFSGDDIVREMLYPEFEAILDGFVPVPDFKGRPAKAVYIIINSDLFITAAVFFILDFDEKGMVDRRWNIPLQQLAEISGKGPDMGAGPIRLACFSQCAIEWQQNKLWDPKMDPPKNSFAMLKKAVQSNRMGLIFRVPQSERGSSAASAKESAALQKKISEHYSQEIRDQIAHVLKDQRLRIATIHSKQHESVIKLQQEHQQRLLAYQNKVKELEAQNAELEAKNHSLKESMDAQAIKVEGIREYFAHKLKAAQMDGGSQLQLLQDNFAIELDVKIQAATAELREMLDMREVELFYRHQNESALKEEIVNLKREYQALLNNGGEQLVTRLSKAGVNFVVHQPGAGQFTIALDDLSKYLEKPAAFIAKHSGVGEQLYSTWFTHYQNPVCSAVDSHGHVCGKPLVRIGAPVEFHEGESDRCEHHQVVSYKLVADGR